MAFSRKEIIAIVTELKQRGMKFAVGGSAAMVYHRIIPRAQDIDIHLFEGSPIKLDGLEDIDIGTSGGCIPEEWTKSLEENNEDNYVSINKLVEFYTFLEKHYFFEISPREVVKEGRLPVIIKSSQEFIKYQKYRGRVLKLNSFKNRV